MSVTVTLHVFSGAPNPTWELSDDQAEELSRLIASIDAITLLKPPGIVGGLGYRGFSIRAVREELLASHIYVHRGILDVERFDANLLLGSSELEAWLLATAGTNVSKEVVQFVEGELAGAAKALSPLEEPYSILRVPPYDPTKWNNDPFIQYNNNCYNYASDKITNTFAQPGLGGGQIYSRFDCQDVSLAAQRDGQRPVGSALSTPAEGHFIALVIWPDNDYHWYRLDDNGLWSHKPGGTPARNTDNSGNAIIDPLACDRGPYTAWCGYYHCVPEFIIIR